MTTDINLITTSSDNGDGTFSNPNIYLDVPDTDIIRVGNIFYMVSTTMHMSPGCPIMKSTDLVNWETITYVYETLDDSDEANLKNGKDMYGNGQWAASLKEHNGKFYVAFNSNTTGTAYVFSTDDIENGTWNRATLGHSYHDCGLFWDDATDGACYLVYGNDIIRYVELEKDASAVKPNGREGILFEGNIAEDGSDVYSRNDSLKNEGTHVYYRNGYYYVFTINALSGRRNEIVHRSTVFPGTNEDWTARIVLDTCFDNYGLNIWGNGVAQGGIVDTEDGKWYCFLFQDHGAVGRVPVLTELIWTEDGWPAAGVNGDTKTVPAIMSIPGTSTGIKSLVTSDEFDSETLDLCWQWNHNPDNSKWSLTERDSHLRLYTTGTAKGWLSARNTLTQRTFGPACSFSASFDVSNMVAGDVAGLGGLANRYGYVGIKCYEDSSKKVIMVDGSNNKGAHNTDADIAEAIDCTTNIVYLKADFIFADENTHYDKMNFFYSFDNVTWNRIGTTATTAYDISPMFMGVRVALFNYATINEGGYVDIDHFHMEVVNG